MKYLFLILLLCNQVTTLQNNVVALAGDGENHLMKWKCNKIQKQKMDETTCSGFRKLKK